MRQGETGDGSLSYDAVYPGFNELMRKYDGF